MNDHDIARVGDVAQAEAARIKRAELHRKQSEDRLAEVLAAHRDTPPQKVDSSCGTAANLPPNASVGRPQLSEAVSAMRSALDNLDVHAFGWMWLSLMETKAYTALTNADWAAINRKLANGLRGSEQQLYQGKLHGHISELVYLDPEVFQAVCHFVVEAAAHHHWESLLQTQFELLRFNHAAFSKTVFEAYKARGIVVDGVDVSLESSKERAERLAARLKSEGMRPLILTYVAALTILDKFDESTSRTFMGLDTDGITRRYARQNDLWQIQRRVLEGRHDTKVLVHRFRDNSAFATAYAGLQRPEVIIRMMEEHLPARYDRVPLMALETASRSLALTASKMPDLAPRIQRYLDVVWQRMLAMGGARSASAIYSRLVTLLRTNQFEGFLATASTLHANLLKARDPLADAAVVPQLIAFHLRMQNYDEALRLLQGLGKFDGSDGFTAVMIRDLLKFSCYANYPHAKRTKLVTEVLRKADASQISATSRGLLLRFLLDGGNPIEGACATLISSDYLSPGYYLKILRRLTQPKGDPTNIPIVYLEAAVHILERQVPTNRAYAGATNTAIWNTVVKSISMSNATEGERATLVKRALECFPDTCQTNARHRLALMRSIVMDSLARDDPFPELAQHWWRQLYAMDSGMHYRPEIEAAVAGFVHAGLLESAMEVIEIACKTATMHGTLRSVLEERDEWTTPEFEQALYGAGITHSNGEIVQRLPRFDVTYGNTRWDDGVKFGDEWGRQSWPDESADGMEGVVEEMEVDEIEVEEMEADEMGADDALEDVD
ncbi:hypothetical protein CspeluHIS016_0501950 [Cutaneotrichosporon spelunceum]|uniref:Uncharacterized protein n=1 Tax=Cutaneotrichosporon spelunceum TaxID=1672016 RepID=A0AAD3YDH2_9TREE|nr:hypothetical protein CspeluHIS016_0501950 [Cutaneotrichosporon spelunceum]